MSSRFDSVKFDEIAATQHLGIKNLFTGLAEFMDEQGLDADDRTHQLVLTKLDEAFMWAGQAIRNAQYIRQAQKQY